MGWRSTAANSAGYPWPQSTVRSRAVRGQDVGGGDRPPVADLFLAAGVCGQRAVEDRPVAQICPGTLEQLQGGFDSTLNLLLAPIGGATLTKRDR